MPIPDLAEAVDFCKPDLLALSASPHTQRVALTDGYAADQNAAVAEENALVGFQNLATDVQTRWCQLAVERAKGQ